MYNARISDHNVSTLQENYLDPSFKLIFIQIHANLKKKNHNMYIVLPLSETTKFSLTQRILTFNFKSRISQED